MYSALAPCEIAVHNCIFYTEINLLSPATAIDYTRLLVLIEKSATASRLSA